MSKEVMTLALEALEQINQRSVSREHAQLSSENAITALREALAEQPAQTATYTCGVCGVSMQMEQLSQQEPVAWANRKDLQNFDMKVRTNGGPLHTVPLYTSPPQRTWVGLSDAELVEFSSAELGPYDMCLEVEVKLKEKNT